jgi:enoyl-CoA hydratase/carnithine racemase
MLRELTYTGRRMGAEEAARHGLVNTLAPDRESAIAAGMALARTIAAKSPLAIAGAKRSLNYSRGRPVEEGPARRGAVECGHSGQCGPARAVRARLTKAEPEFGRSASEARNFTRKWSA